MSAALGGTGIVDILIIGPVVLAIIYFPRCT
jgi:hypothetical protein